ncbi:hypothetical protein ACHAWX_004042 [Stephanocyclus meneghinianus]
MPMETPPPGTPANVLHSLISANRRRAFENKEFLSAIPLAGIHDALSAKIFAQSGAPALFLSGFGVSASLLGVPDAGVTNLVEMEQVTRNVCSAMRNNLCLKVIPPLIVDGDTGYGGSPNMLRTISALASAGAAAITIEDQAFPKKCTIAAGEKIRVVEREEAVLRVRGALRARDLHCERVSLSTSASTSAGDGCWIVARTDCRLAFGFNEVVERCLRFEELGADIVYAENLQSIDEYLKLREKLDRRTVTMVAQVQENTMRNGSEKQREGKPLLDAKKIGELGYDLALFGVTPLQCVIGSLMSVADQFYQNNGVIESNVEVADEQPSMINFEIVKQVVGFDELENFERTYPCG